MVYEYQEKTFGFLTELIEKLEKITDSKKSLKIGFIRENYHLGNGDMVKIKGNLYLHLNYGNNFSVVGNFENGIEVKDEFDIVDSEAYVRFDKNIFEQLNEWIDKIYENDKKLIEFHNKLNNELKYLIKSL